MQQKKRKQEGSQNRTRPSDDIRNRAVFTVENQNLDNGLGELMPNRSTPVDQHIHAQINSNSVPSITKDDSNPSLTQDNSDPNINIQEELSNREVVSEFQKQQNEGGKSRYEKSNEDGFDFEYDDFDIEDPQDGKPPNKSNLI
jgi:hypothetical protein